MAVYAPRPGATPPILAVPAVPGTGSPGSRQSRPAFRFVQDAHT